MRFILSIEKPKNLYEIHLREHYFVSDKLIERTDILLTSLSEKKCKAEYERIQKELAGEYFKFIVNNQSTKGLPFCIIEPSKALYKLFDGTEDL